MAFQHMPVGTIHTINNIPMFTEWVSPALERLCVRAPAGASVVKIPTSFSGPIAAITTDNDRVPFRLRFDVANGETKWSQWFTKIADIGSLLREKLFESYSLNEVHRTLMKQFWPNGNLVDNRAIGLSFNLYVEFQTPLETNVEVTFSRANVWVNIRDNTNGKVESGVHYVYDNNASF